jgi:hypothetical protein
MGSLRSVAKRDKATRFYLETDKTKIQRKFGYLKKYSGNLIHLVTRYKYHEGKNLVLKVI